MEKLGAQEVERQIRNLPQWKLQGSEIRRTFQFKNFLQAIDFVNRLAKIAEEANHHPDIDIRWNKVTLALTTHDAGGLTSSDFDLAAKADQLA